MECSWKLESFVRHVKLSSHLLVILGSVQPLIRRSEESISIEHRLEVHRGLQEVVQGANIKFHSLVPHLDLGRIGSLRVIGVGIKGIYPIKVKVWGKTLKFDACTLNTFLKTRVNLQPMPGNDAFLTPYD